MPTVFILNPKEVTSLPPTLMSLVFWPNFRFKIPEKRLFLREIMAQYETPFFSLADSPKTADFVAVPLEYFFAKKYAPHYLARAYDSAARAGKKVLLFDYTDYVDTTPELPSHTVLFRVSAYRHHKRHNEIVMPYFVEDMGVRFDIAPKERGAPLVVGYCGQAEFGSPAKHVKAIVKDGCRNIRLRLQRDAFQVAHRQGILWRRACLRQLEKSDIARHIIKRSFYSLHSSGVSRDHGEIRKEYAHNLSQCDLALCVRGDANASQRFYEALSASRIPLFLDTDCVLPLEELISYDEFMVRIPSSDIRRIGEYVREFDRSTSAASFVEREKRAREIYERHLRLDRYFSIVFDRAKSPYKDILYSTKD